MRTVLLPFTGMQSCGAGSQYSERDSQREPHKGHVVGLVCSALGVARDDKEMISKVARMRMGVRVDMEPKLAVDFQTSGSGSFPLTLMLGIDKVKPTKYRTIRAEGSPSSDPSIQRKTFLTDAFFLVALCGEDDLAKRIHEALGKPVFGLSLGRKCFKPMIPMKLKDGLVGMNIEQAFKEYPWLPSLIISPFGHGQRPWWIDRMEREAKKSGVRALIEVSPSEVGRNVRRVFDVPKSFVQEERTTMIRGARHVRMAMIPFPGGAKS